MRLLLSAGLAFGQGTSLVGLVLDGSVTANHGGVAAVRRSLEEAR